MKDEKIVRIKCIHTGAGPTIFGLIEDEIICRCRVPIEISHITNPSIISEVSSFNGITSHATNEIMKMYMYALNSGADIILNMCSSVGSIANAAKAIVEMSGCYLVRIDQQMSKKVVAEYSKLGVVATLNSTLIPSRALLDECAVEQNKMIAITEILAEGAFGLNRDQLTDCLVKVIASKVNDVEALVFAQASMAVCAEDISKHFSIPVFTSPKFAAEEVADLANNLN